MANERKNYSFLHICDAVNPKNGAAYKHITVDGTLSRFEVKQRQDDGSYFLTAQLPINNRTKVINNALGSHFDENEETIWANVVFRWPNVAERMDKFRGERTSARMNAIVGRVSVRPFKDRNGNDREQLQISLEDFSAAYVPKDGAQNSGNNGGNNNGGGNRYGNNNGGSNTYGNNGGGYSYQQPGSVAQTGGFAELDDDDGELPF